MEESDNGIPPLSKSGIPQGICEFESHLLRRPDNNRRILKKENRINMGRARLKLNQKIYRAGHPHRLRHAEAWLRRDGVRRGRAKAGIASPGIFKLCTTFVP